MPRTTQPARTYPKFRVQALGPWLGMTDTVEPGAAVRDRAQFLGNCYATNTDQGVAIVGVPGFLKVGTQLGGVGARTIQWIGQFNNSTGTKKSIVVCNGEVVEYNHGTDSFATRLTAAQITGAGITFSATARVYGQVFNDYLILSDGLNKAFAWDGTAGAGMTLISNAAGAWYGQPVVRAQKLAAIKANEPDTWVWSEEGQVNTGYEAGGYTNAWNIAGTKGERLTAIAATEEYFGIIRPRTTTAIYGAFNAEFKTTSTRPSASERTGSASPGGVLVTDEGTFVVDADGRPQFWARGAGYLQDPPLWSDADVSTRSIARANLGNVEIVPDDLAGLIWIGLPGSGQTYPTLWLLYERTGGRPNLVGTASGYPSQRTGVWEDATGAPRLVHGGIDDGYVYLHGTPQDGPWNRAFAAGTVAITHTLTIPVPDADIVQDKYYDRFTIESSASTDQVVSVTVQTPDGTTAAQSLTIAGSGTGGLWDVGLWDAATWAGSGIDQKVDCNVHARGRWAIVRIRHAALNEPFNVTNAQIETFVDGREPALV